MKLLYAPQSPFARKVRVAAIELGLGDRLSLEYVEAFPGKDNFAYASMINPLRKLPALVLDDETVLIDSNVICEYLDRLAGGNRLVPKGGDLRWRVLSDCAAAQGLCEALVLIRYETWLRPQEKRWDVWLDDQWDKVWTVLQHFEDAEVSPIVRRPELLDISQITLACGIGYLQFRHTNADWRARFSKTAEWFSAISLRPSLSMTEPQPAPSN
jgi:glutathione S-transferase